MNSLLPSITTTLGLCGKQTIKSLTFLARLEGRGGGGIVANMEQRKGGGGKGLKD
jgi:hypothetical protein